MNIVLSGYGKMGREVEKLAITRGHEIVARIDNDQDWHKLSVENSTANMVIDFSQPDVAVENFKKCFEIGLPVVTGTTGWLAELEVIKDLCIQKDCAFFYSANFSLGVYILLHLNRQLSKIMGELKEYRVEINETHHIHKLDSPSGTALKLAGDIIASSGRYTNWTANDNMQPGEIVINSKRIGEVAGVHEVIWESSSDKIIITHEAKNRTGFAFGALLAAEFLQNKKGVYTMENLMKSYF